VFEFGGIYLKMAMAAKLLPSSKYQKEFLVFRVLSHAPQQLYILNLKLDIEETIFNVCKMILKQNHLKKELFSGERKKSNAFLLKLFYTIPFLKI
jgi:hypothetical protein